MAEKVDQATRNAQAAATTGTIGAFIGFLFGGPVGAAVIGSALAAGGAMAKNALDSHDDDDDD